MAMVVNVFVGFALRSSSHHSESNVRCWLIQNNIWILHSRLRPYTQLRYIKSQSKLCKVWLVASLVWVMGAWHVYLCVCVFVYYNFFVWKKLNFHCWKKDDNDKEKSLSFSPPILHSVKAGQLDKSVSLED